MGKLGNGSITTKDVLNGNDLIVIGDSEDSFSSKESAISNLKRAVLGYREYSANVLWEEEAPSFSNSKNPYSLTVTGSYTDFGQAFIEISGITLTEDNCDLFLNIRNITVGEINVLSDFTDGKIRLRGVDPDEQITSGADVRLTIRIHD